MSPETKFLGANGDRKIPSFPVQLTTSRIGNLIRLIHTLAGCVTIIFKKKNTVLYRSRVSV